MKGRRILVTGASRGIGRAVALELGRRGAFVVGVYRSAEREAAQVRLALGAGGRVLAADLTDPSGRQAVVEACGDGIDGAVLAAGIVRRGPLAAMPAGGAEDPVTVQIRTNLEAPLLLVRALLAGAVLRPGASLVFVGSNLARLGVAGAVAYAAAKAGLEGAVRSLAAELGPEGVRVNAVAPGLLLTDMTRDRDPTALAAVAQGTPLRRLGEPADVVGPILFFLSPGSEFVTGQVLDVDGGASAAGV